MTARQLRWILLCELLAYASLGNWVVSANGWTPLQALELVAGLFFAGRLMFVLATFALSRPASDVAPPAMRMGPLGVLRMVAGEYLAFFLLFTVVQPFERLWLGPDRLTKFTGARLPLLLIHGYQCNRGFWFWLRPRLEAAGWTVATHNLEPVWTDIDDYAQGIEQRIDEVLAATGAPQVILIGHSMGGLVLRAYLRRHGRDKVAGIVTLGSPHQGTRLAQLGIGRNARQMRVGSSWLAALARPDAVPLPRAAVSIFSCHDNYVFPQRACSTLEGAANIAIGGVSHLGMAVSPLVQEKLLAALVQTRFEKP